MGDPKTAKCAQVLRGHMKPVEYAVELPSGELASCSVDCSARVWDVLRGECIRTLQHQAAVTSLTAVADGLLVCASEDETVRMWDVSTGKCIQVLNADQDDDEWDVNCVAQLSNGQLATCGDSR